MVNFIICEDNDHVRKINENIISKITMPLDFNYKVYSYNGYNDNLKKIINTPSDVKIYLLDLEMPKKSGLDIAKEIRKTDWESIIIILTSHDELELKILKQKLLIYDFISKFDNYEIRLKDSINTILNRIETNKILSFKSNGEIHHIKFSNIMYIYRDNSIGKIIVVTNDNKYPVTESLVSLASRLDSKFFHSHRACYVNLNLISRVDFKNSTIYFINGSTTDYLSRNYKKDLRKLL